MDPTPAEAAQINSINEVCEWAALAGAHGQQTTPRGALYHTLGCTGTEHWRAIASFSEADWMAIVGRVRIVTGAEDEERQENPLTPIQLGQAGNVGRCARHLGGFGAAAIRAGTGGESQPVGGSSSAETDGSAKTPEVKRKVKLSHVIDQTNELEVAIIDQDKLRAGYTHYKRTFGSFPDPKKELTQEQLTALDALIGMDAVPYADFAVWAPFGHRIQRKVKLTGMVMGPDGKLQNIELKGPPNYETWEECFSLWQTGMVMLQAISFATTERYKETIKQYWTRYGSESWHLIYQVDVRTRLEKFERTRRKAEVAKEEATRHGGGHSFDPGQPWQWVLDDVIDDAQWWRQELEEPALWLKNKVASRAEVLDGDTPIASAQSQSSTKRKASEYDFVSNRFKSHRTTGDGSRLTHNRRNVKLCEQYQKGQCDWTVGGDKCGYRRGEAHQCAICLSPDGHGADSCTKSLRQPTRSTSSGTGRGGKGGKAGKGKKGFKK